MTSNVRSNSPLRFIPPWTYLSIFVLGCISLLGSNAEDSPPPAKPVTHWIAQLNNEDFGKRVEAERNLLKAGKEALPLLKLASESGPAETKMRAQRLHVRVWIKSTLQDMDNALPGGQFVQGELEITRKFMKKNWKLTGKFWAHKDDKRFAIHTHIKQNNLMQTLKVVCNGSHVFIERPMPPRPLGEANRRAVKYKMETLAKFGDGNHQSPLARMKNVPNRFDFSEISLTTLNKQSCVLLQGKLKKGILEKTVKEAQALGGVAAGQKAEQLMKQIKTARLYIIQATGLPKMLEILDEGNNVIEGILLQKVSAVTAIEPKTFIYSPPDGTRIIDIDARLKARNEAKKTP